MFEALSMSSTPISTATALRRVRTVKRPSAKSSAASVAQKAGRISKSRSTLEDRRKKLSDLQAKGQELDAEYRAEVSKITSTAALPGIETSVVKPKKTGIDVRFFALGWMPA
jgi:hypothetical protein